MNPKERGKSDLVRSIEGLSMNIETTDLPVGAYTVWWVVFNNPSACSDGECGENDVLPPNVNPEADVAVMWAAGGVVGPDRMAHFSGSLGVGPDGAPGPILWGEYSNPTTSIVHLIVRYHGPASYDDAAALGEQIITVGGARDEDTNGTDPLGFARYEPQVAIHE